MALWKPMNLKERTYLCYLSVLRIYVGFYILSQGVQKFQRDFPRGDWMGRQIGEIAVGATLLLGFWTRWSSLVALIMVINYYLGPGTVRRSVMMAHQEILMVALAIFVLANPGRTLGLDGVFFSARKGRAAS